MTADRSMTLIRVTLALVLVMVAVLLAAGCAEQALGPEPDISQVPVNTTPWITIDPIGDKYVGEKISIVARTNFPVGDEIRVRIGPSSPTLCPKAGCSAIDERGIVKVIDDRNGLNKTVFDFDTSVLPPNEYFVSAEQDAKNISVYILFNTLEVRKYAP